MKLNNSFFYTLRENVKDEESISGNLLVRGGYIKKNGNGIYMFLPLGFKVLKNIENIVREEMNKTGAQELVMPFLIPEEVYVSSGRRDNFGSDMFSLKDRYNRNYVLGPTHEELFTIAASLKIKSYKDLPFNLYQIANKYRDEPRPRYGLIRVREFVMKDAYSFDIDDASLQVSYDKMFNAYKNIFNRIGINYAIVKADTGTMGGTLSEEFQALTNIGEDTVVLCEHCNYASNLEVSECVKNKSKSDEGFKEKELIHTPNHGTVLELVDILKFDIEKIVKTLIYQVDDKFYACMIAGDRDINELKLKKLLNAHDVYLADYEDVLKITNAEIGFAGPIGLNIPIIVDQDVMELKNFLVGANKTDYHYINVNLNDFKQDIIADIKNVCEGDLCPKCNHKLLFKKGIEIGNTFKLGTKYSEALGLKYLDQNNNLNPVVMGCYGIGLGRILASVVEQSYDDKGIVWPINIAPYKVAIVLINNNDSTQITLADKIYDDLIKNNIDVILDNRSERPGVKFNDMDLIGIPIRITVGKNANEQIVEFKLRSKEEIELVNYNDILNKIKNYIK